MGGALSTGLKRFLDVSLASSLLAFLSPLFVAIVVAIRLTSPGPAFFTQRRLGYGGREFRMLKFRTMVLGAERLEPSLAETQPGRTFFKITNDPRVTPLGRLLRRYSLDELPQLVNVLRGEMSLVGPRPLLQSDFKNLPRAYRKLRSRVPPGMTGLWQVSGRSTTTGAQRVALDVSYAVSWSLGKDFAILARTVPVVVLGKGAV